MRCVCVIPHGARANTDFFQAVHRDSLRVASPTPSLGTAPTSFSGPQQALTFDHVLSPAHAPAAAVSGPLLEALAAGRDATAVLLTPSAESAAAEPTGACALAECTAVTFDIATALLSQVLRVANTPPSLSPAAAAPPDLSASLPPFRAPYPRARLSVFTVSATDRVALDELAEGRAVSQLSLLQSRVVEPGGSARGGSSPETPSASTAAWGVALRILADRQEQATTQPGSLATRTACFIRVQLESASAESSAVVVPSSSATGPVLTIVDVGSDQTLLQQVLLILRRRCPGAAAAAYPASGPLRWALEPRVSGASTRLQVVAVPHPTAAPIHTMRLLRLVAELHFLRSRGARTGETSEVAPRSAGSSAREGAGSSDAIQQRSHYSSPAAFSASPRESASPARNVSSYPGGSARSATREPQETPREHSYIGAPSVLFDFDTSSVAAAAGADFFSSNTLSSDPSIQRLPSPRRAGATCTDDADGGGSQAVRVQEQRIRLLERRLDDVTRKWGAAQALAEREREAAAAATAAAQKAVQEAAEARRRLGQLETEYDELCETVPKLTEKATSTTQQKERMRKALEKARVEAEEARVKNAALESRAARLEQELLVQRRIAAHELRKSQQQKQERTDVNTNHHGGTGSHPFTERDPNLPSSRAKGPGGPASVETRRRAAPRGRLQTSADHTPPSSSSAGAAANADAAAPLSSAHPVVAGLPGDLAAAVVMAMEEMKRTNMQLETEVARLRQRLRVAQEAGAGGGGSCGADGMIGAPSAKVNDVAGVCTNCAHLEQQLAEVSSQVEAARRARRDAAEAAPAAPLCGPPAHAAAIVGSVLASLVSGCTSLETQLQSLLETARRRRPSRPRANDSATPTSDPSVHHLHFSSVERQSESTGAPPIAEILQEHIAAVAALRRTLVDVASRQLPSASVPGRVDASITETSVVGADDTHSRVATAATAPLLSRLLQFECERTQAALDFVPVFERLAVATEHLRMQSRRHSAD